MDISFNKAQLLNQGVMIGAQGSLNCSSTIHKFLKVNFFILINTQIILGQRSQPYGVAGRRKV